MRQARDRQRESIALSGSNSGKSVANIFRHRSSSKRGHELPPLLNDNKVFLTDDTDKAELFSAFFAKHLATESDLILLVTDDTLSYTPNGHLVCVRGMIQDMFDSELYISSPLSSPLAIAMWNICSALTGDSVFPITLPPLNISHWEGLIQSLHCILPQVSLIPLTVDSLNNGPLLMPVREVAIDELDSGLLQWPTGSEEEDFVKAPLIMHLIPNYINSHQMGAGALKQLYHQGQQLDRINENMDTIHNDLKEAERELDNLEK
ncbi:hypothetical protein SprV_0702323000 [Sparganum proliferum]